MKTLESRILEDVRLQGGTTWHLLHGKARHKIGYYVNLKGFERTVPVYDDGTLITEESIAEYIQANRSILESKGHYFGIWVENDIAYLDISVWIHQKDKAIYFATLQRQEAIWSCKKQTFLNIPYYGYLLILRANKQEGIQ